MTDKQNHLWDLVKQAQNVRMDYDLFERLMKARRYAARYHRLCEMACNGEGVFADGDEEAQEMAFRQIENKLFELFHSAEINLKRTDFQRDPRGWEIKLRHIPTDTDLSDWLYRAL